MGKALNMHGRKLMAFIFVFLVLFTGSISCNSSATPTTSPSGEYQLVHRNLQQPVDHNNAGGPSFDEGIDLLVPAGAAADSAVFFVLGNEQALTSSELVKLYNGYGAPGDVIFVQAEHRGYGHSITSDADQSVPTYVKIDQALADYHDVVQALKKQYHGPWVAAGYSYGGGLVINFAASYPDDVNTILSSSGVVDWPFIMETYDKQVRITMGQDTYQRLAQHIKNLEPKEMFDNNWMEREFLIGFIHGMTQFGQYKFLLPAFRSFTALPTSSFLGLLHFIDNTVAGGSGWAYALSNAKKNLTHDEAVTGTYGWRVWRYQQCTETGIFEISAKPDGIFTRNKNDFFAESKALFGKEPESAVNLPWSPRSMLDRLTVPLVYVGGGMDPWLGLGLDKNYSIKNGKYFYVPDGQHCPDMNDVQLGKQVMAELLKYARK